MFKNSVTLFIFMMAINWTACLVPPKFQWKTIDFTWEGGTREKAMADESYIPKNVMPTGLARWQDKLFITIPRWKKGVPASLNYIPLNGTQQQPLTPYPSWHDAFVSNKACCASSNSTVVSAFRVTVDKSDRLWVVDNGVADMASTVRQIADPAIFVFDLTSDKLIHKYVFSDEELKDCSVLTSIVVDESGGRDNTFAYITDMGASAVVVYSLAEGRAWRVEHPYFKFDQAAGVYCVGGVDFYWSDGVSSATLAPPQRDGTSDFYFHPTSSTKLFRISTRVLKNKHATRDEISKAMEIVGDRGPNSQATACDMDPKRNVIFYTQLSKNGVGCWKVGSAFCEDNTPLIISDCNLLEFPNDLKVDAEGNIWILSDRQSRFLYDAMDFEQFNFRILTAPVAKVIEGSTCEKPTKPGSAKSKPSSAKAKDDKQKGGFFKRKSAGK